jgi:hypothetical protein
MRRFLALLAEEVEVDLPSRRRRSTASSRSRPDAPAQDRLFVALARGLVEEAVAERGFVLDCSGGAARRPPRT